MKNIVTIAMVYCLTALSVPAATYYTSPAGNDTNAGTSPETAWATLKRSVDALRSGDTLIVGEGDYPIHKDAFTMQGTPEPGEDISQPIVIRAARPQGAVVHGDQPLSGFSKLDGRQFVYRCNAPENLLQVLESDTDIVYERVGTLTDLDEVLGAYLVDPATKSLYVHTSDGRSPANHAMCGITQSTAGYSNMSPIDQPTRSFIVDGLVFKGFSSMALHLGAARNITIRNCVVYHNCDGIYLAGFGRNCVIENNLAFSNNIHRQGARENAGIIINGDVVGIMVSNNVARYNRSNNIRLYSLTGTTTDVTFINNRSYGDAPTWFKPAREGCTMIGNVIEGHGTSFSGSHNTLRGYTNAERPPQSDDELVFGTNAESKAAAKFVDPVGGDYRLQADSPFRGKGKKGGDLGAFAYKDEVFFVKPDGDDKAVGTSVASAWKNLAQAVKRLKPGQTLYVMAGTYDGPVSINQKGTAAAPIQIRRRGTDTVIIDGKGKTPEGFTLDGAAFVQIDGFEFRGFNQAAIAASAANNLTLQKCLIHDNKGAGLKLQGCRDAFLRDNTIAANGVGVNIAKHAGAIELVNNILQANRVAQFQADALPTDGYYGNHNNWSGSTLAQIGQQEFKSLTNLQTTIRERPGSMQADAQFADAARGDYRVKPSSSCRGRGFLERTIGRGDEVPLIEATAEIQNVRVHYVGGTTATITYWTPQHPSYSVVEYQTGNDKPTTVLVDFNFRIFHVVSLTGLKPNTTYTFRSGAKHASQSWVDHARTSYNVDAAPPADATTFGAKADFKTLPADPEGRTLYVAIDGDDKRDGLTPATAWRTLRQASEQAHAGDTVLIGPGAYSEVLAPFNSGLSEDRRITFRAAKPREAIIDGANHMIPWAVKIINRDYVTVDGFAIQRQDGDDFAMTQTSPYSTQVVIAQSRFGTLQNCHLDGGKAFPDTGWAAVFGVWLHDAEGARVENNFFFKETWGLRSTTATPPRPDYVPPLVKNNTFFYTSIWTLHVTGGGDYLKLRNNLFGEVCRAKSGLAYIRCWYPTSKLDSDYNYFYWHNDKPRDLSNSRVGMWHGRKETEATGGIIDGGLVGWQKISGQDRHSQEGFFPSNNLYDVLDFTPGGKPYQGKGEAGADIGCTWVGKHTDQITFDNSPTDIPPWQKN